MTRKMLQCLITNIFVDFNTLIKKYCLKNWSSIHLRNNDILLSPTQKYYFFLSKKYCIGIGIGNTDPICIWYWIDTKFCSIAHHYCKIVKWLHSVFKRWPKKELHFHNCLHSMVVNIPLVLHSFQKSISNISRALFACFRHVLNIIFILGVLWLNVLYIRWFSCIQSGLLSCQLRSLWNIRLSMFCILKGKYCFFV